MDLDDLTTPRFEQCIVRGSRMSKRNELATVKGVAGRELACKLAQENLSLAWGDLPWHQEDWSRMGQRVL